MAIKEQEGLLIPYGFLHRELRRMVDLYFFEHLLYEVGIGWVFYIHDRPYNLPSVVWPIFVCLFYSSGQLSLREVEMASIRPQSKWGSPHLSDLKTHIFCLFPGSFPVPSGKYSALALPHLLLVPVLKSSFSWLLLRFWLWKIRCLTKIYAEMIMGSVSRRAMRTMTLALSMIVSAGVSVRLCLSWPARKQLCPPAQQRASPAAVRTRQLSCSSVQPTACVSACLGLMDKSLHEWN